MTLSEYIWFIKTSYGYVGDWREFVMGLIPALIIYRRLTIEGR